MGTRDVHIWVDWSNGGLVTGLNSAAPAKLNFTVQGDTPRLVLHRLEVDNDATSLSLYKEVAIDAATIKAGISEVVDGPPKFGLWQVQVGADAAAVTAPLQYNISKPDLGKALSLLPAVVALGGLTVDSAVDGDATNIYIIRWNNQTETTPFTVVENHLRPKSFSRVSFYQTDEDSFFVLKIFVAPFAFTDAFATTPPSAPAIDPAPVRPGSISANEIQALSIPSDATGQFDLKFLSIASPLITVDGINAGAIQTALNAIIPDGATRFSVSQPAANLFYIEFVGPLAKEAQDPLDVDVFNQVAIATPAADLPLTGIPLEVIQQGRGTWPALLEIVFYDSAGDEITKVVPTAVTMYNDMIDGTMALDIPGWLLSATEAAEAISDPTIPIISGTLSWSTIFGDGAGSVWTFNHNLSTLYPIVEVYTLFPYQRVPDNEYLTEILDSMNVRLTFSAPHDLNSIRVVILNTEAQTVLNNHHHPISDIDGLQAELDALNAALATFSISTPLALSMIPLLPWDKIGWTGTTRQTIPDFLLPSTIPRLDANGFIPLTNIPPEVPRIDNATGDLLVSRTDPTTGLVTTQVLWNTETGFPTDVINSIADGLAGTAAFTNAIILALQSGVQLPDGSIPFIFDDFDFIYPPVQIRPTTTKVVPGNGTSTQETDLVAGDQTSKTTTTQPTTSTETQTVQIFERLPLAVSYGATVDLVGKVITLDDLAANTLGQTQVPAQVRTINGRRGQSFPAFAWLVRGNEIIYPSRQEGAIAYGTEMETMLFRTPKITSELLAPGSQLVVPFQLQASLKGNVQGKIDLSIEMGVVADETFSFTWAPMTLNIASGGTEPSMQEISLSEAMGAHSFMVTIARAADGTLTGTMKRWGRVQTFTPVPLPFAIRARALRFDAEAIPTLPGSIGSMHLFRPAFIASIAPL